MMKIRLIHLFLLATLIMATGCAGFQDLMYKRAIQKRACIAYSQVESTCGQRRGPHYEDGWVAGYMDVANGSEGKKRPFAPSKYHGPRFQTAKGQQFVMNWHEGYEFGMQYALETNADTCHTIPTLGSASLPESEPLIPDWYFANEQVVRPEYELEEIAPAEMKQEKASDKDDASGDEDETKSDEAEGDDDSGGTEKQSDSENGDTPKNGRRKEISPSDIIVEPAGKGRGVPMSPTPNRTNNGDSNLLPPNQEKPNLPEPAALPDSFQPEIGKNGADNHRRIKPAQFNRTDLSRRKTIFPAPARNISSSDPGLSRESTSSDPGAAQATGATRSPVVARRISDQEIPKSQQQSGRIIFQFNKEKQRQTEEAASTPIREAVQLKKVGRTDVVPPYERTSPASQPVRRTSLETMVEPETEQPDAKQPGVELSTRETKVVDQISDPEPVRASVGDRHSSRRVRTAE